MPAWDELFAGFVASVDWPGAGVWHEIADAYPDVLVLPSVRDVDGWWDSASRTIFLSLASGTPRAGSGRTEADDMSDAMMATFTPTTSTRPRRRRRSWPTTTKCGPPANRASCSTGRSRMGGSRSPRRSASRVPDEPFPDLNTADQFCSFAGLDG